MKKSKLNFGSLLSKNEWSKADETMVEKILNSNLQTVRENKSSFAQLFEKIISSGNQRLVRKMQKLLTACKKHQIIFSQESLKKVYETQEAAPEEEVVTIKSLDKALVLMCLFDFAKAGTSSVFNPLRIFAPELSLAKAKKLVAEAFVFDYVYGKAIKVDLSGDAFSPYLYDRDNGKGRAQAAIDYAKKLSGAIQD